MQTLGKYMYSESCCTLNTISRKICKHFLFIERQNYYFFHVNDSFFVNGVPPGMCFLFP